MHSVANKKEKLHGIHSLIENITFLISVYNRIKKKVNFILVTFSEILNGLNSEQDFEK